MDKYSKTLELRTRMAELFDLPADLVAGLAHMELLGDRQFFLEGHEGILAYSDTQIDISAGKGIVRVRGGSLELRRMTEHEVRIRGKIDAVEFIG
ncbi:MAG: YabP/YqfC family sporulation protein [Oscillospiraceae bacterium]|nr:YabP/YqfC family sporulation protein [Oscillospiraceae bacterium]